MELEWVEKVFIVMLTTNILNNYYVLHNVMEFCNFVKLDGQ